MSEFAFELELCAALEERCDGIVSRQLGANVTDPGGRILDVVLVRPGPEFDDRRALTGETIPNVALQSRVGPGRFRYWKECFDCHPRRARATVDRAVDIGFFERERRNGRDYVRQVARYPDWFDGIVGIENKPDLGRPGDLQAQLRTDVSLGIVDEVVLATRSYVTRAHLNRIPDEVGVWRIHDMDSKDIEIEVLRGPTQLPVDQGGIEPLESHPGRTDVAVVSADDKARARRWLAERAYGKGWRTYTFPECGACRADDPNGATLPFCEWKGRVVDAGSECGSSCGGYDPDSTLDWNSDIDLETERERRTAWVAMPDGKQRQQTGLDRFE